MEKQKKIGKHKTYYYLEVDKIFPVEDRTIRETQFIERCLDIMFVDLESEDNEDIILTNNQLIYLLTGIVREWDSFKGKSLYELMTSLKHKPFSEMRKTEFDDLNYIRLKDFFTTDEILTYFEMDDPKTIKFIRDYLKDRLNVNTEKDDLIVLEPTDSQHIILLIYDIVKTFENETQKL